MKSNRGVGWSRLDNAAKIFPSTSHKTNTSVFRFYCELCEAVQPLLLQTATEQALVEFPDFRCVLRKGAFWYYLELAELSPVVKPEEKNLCPQIYMGDNNTLLFQVSYYEKRINLEIYHALADGTGALQFLKTIVYYYLKVAHSEALPEDLIFLENDASYSEKSADGFAKYYKKQKAPMRSKGKKSYDLRYRRNEEEALQVIEAIVSVKEVVALARSLGTTLTVLLTALLFESIHKEMSLQMAVRPVVIMVPVNLRQFFPSETMRNFFGLIDISYDFGTRTGEFSDILEVVTQALKEKVTPEYLSAKMNYFAALERNVFAKIAPLPVKNFFLRCGRYVESKRETAVISNMGRTTMPEELCPYIDFFGVLASTDKIQLCMCSFGDKLQIGFTSAFISTDIQKNFIRALTERGVSATIRCNDFFKEEEHPC